MILWFYDSKMNRKIEKVQTHQMHNYTYCLAYARVHERDIHVYKSIHIHVLQSQHSALEYTLHMIEAITILFSRG